MREHKGVLLIAIGIIHTLVGVLEGSSVLADIAREGFFNAIKWDAPRVGLFWFLFSGALIILLGQLCFWVENRIERPLPSFVGWELLAFSVCGAALMPISGFWLVIALAIYMLVTSQRAAKSPARVASKHTA